MAETGFSAGGTVEKNLSETSERAFPDGIRPVWIASYPRSGNTFLRILLQNFFRLPTYSVYNVEGQGFADPSAAALDEAPMLPRNWRVLLSEANQAKKILIKTHDRPEAEGPAIYLIRDGRAAIDSYFHYHKKFAFEKPTLTEVIAGACQFGGWGDHYLGWEPKTRAQTLFLRYEDLVSRPEQLIPVIGEFLNEKPANGHVPSFEELQHQFPVFFRRGCNDDFLREWTPGQMALFNELYGTVMEDLQYPLKEPGEVVTDTATELARSAARWHELYLEKLASLGNTAAICQQVYDENERLKNEFRRLSEEMEKKDALLVPLLRSIWVKMGLALGLLRRADATKKRPARQSVPTETAATREQASVN